MLSFVVMPCLDEVGVVADAIASLGFIAEGGCPLGTHLVVVDNGSTDGTLRLLHGIRDGSRAPIHVVSEPVRGFVPPRRRGVEEAHAVAHAMGAVERDVLILQADADTIYRDGYVATMRDVAATSEGALFEGSTKPPADFVRDHADYLIAQRIVDEHTEPLDAEDEDEVVVDDKVCAFRLSDYLGWGGLFEEWAKTGDAIHAETTRMFIRARLRHGARKVRVNLAGAMPSRRKIAQDPWLQYATVGFPREASWTTSVRATAGAPVGVDEFSSSVLEGKQGEAVFLRRAHQLALFRFLPALIARAGGREAFRPMPPDVLSALAALPSRSGEEIAQAPGRTLLDVLGLIQRRRDLFFGPQP